MGNSNIELLIFFQILYLNSISCRDPAPLYIFCPAVFKAYFCDVSISAIAYYTFSQLYKFLHMQTAEISFLVCQFQMSS